jgi:putative salt-induced outer membrane protein YdiY
MAVLFLRYFYPIIFNAIVANGCTIAPTLSADIGLSIPVTDKLDTKISLDWSYDNQPEEGLEQIDRKVNFGINYKW